MTPTRTPNEVARAERAGVRSAQLAQPRNPYPPGDPCAEAWQQGNRSERKRRLGHQAASELYPR